MKKPLSNQEEIKYIAIDEQEERVAALIKLAIHDPDRILQALDSQQGEVV